MQAFFLRRYVAALCPFLSLLAFESTNAHAYPVAPPSTSTLTYISMPSSQGIDGSQNSSALHTHPSYKPSTLSLTPEKYKAHETYESFLNKNHPTAHKKLVVAKKSAPHPHRFKKLLSDMVPRLHSPLYRFTWQVRGIAGFSTYASQVGDPPNPAGYNTAVMHLKGQYGLGLTFSYYATEHFAFQGSGDLTDQYGVVTNVYMVPDANGGFTTYTPPNRAAHLILATLSLNAQYHALPDHLIDPYIGAGGLIAVSIDFKHVEQQHTATVGTRPGFDVQMGMNIKLRPDVFASLDLRKLWSSTWLNVRDDRNTYAQNTVERHVVTMNPWLFALGLGWKF